MWQDPRVRHAITAVICFATHRHFDTFSTRFLHSPAHCSLRILESRLEATFAGCLIRVLVALLSILLALTPCCLQESEYEVDMDNLLYFMLTLIGTTLCCCTAVACWKRNKYDGTCTPHLEPTTSHVLFGGVVTLRMFAIWCVPPCPCDGCATQRQARARMQE